MKECSSDAPKVPPRPCTLDAVPERVRQIAMLRGLGYSYRQIADPLHVTPRVFKEGRSRLGEGGTFFATKCC